MPRPNRLVIGLSAFLTALAAGSAIAGAAPLELLNGRFEVSARWSTATRQDVPATPVPLTGNTGYFTFFDPSNVEVVVKVLDACQSSSPRFWVFAAGLTNVEVTLEVRDAWSGEQRTFHSPGGRPFAPLQRTDLFATCAAPRPCGQGNAADLAASPRADQRAEEVALFLDGEVVARSATYARVRADLAALAAAVPDLDDYGFLPRFSTQSLLVRVDGDTSHLPEGPDWACLNQWYGVTSIEPLIGSTKVLHFRPRLDQARIADDYRALAGVASADVDHVIRIGEFPFHDLCALRSGGDAIVYYFTGAGPAPRQFRSLPGSAPVAEPFDATSFAGCAAITAQ